MGEGYTKAQLRTKVRDVSRDTASADADRAVQDSEIDDWVLDALIDLSWRTRTFRKEISSTMPDGTGTLAFPADYISLLYLRLGTDDDVEFVDEQTFFIWKDDLATPPHTLGRLEDKIYLYPAPASGSAYLLGEVAQQAALAGETDKPDLPRRWQPKAIQYAVAQMMLYFRNFDVADRYMSMYEAGLPPRPNNERTITGPLSFGVELGPWDLDPEAKHI